MIKSIKIQFGIGSQVEPMKKASIDATNNQIACPILGRNSINPAKIPIAKANGIPRIKPAIVKIVATTAASTICPRKKLFQIRFISSRRRTILAIIWWRYTFKPISYGVAVQNQVERDDENKNQPDDGGNYFNKESQCLP